MSILKDLVEKTRTQTRTQGELVEGEGVRNFEFGNASGEDRYPNASEYSDQNTDVGYQPKETETVKVIGEDQIARKSKQIASSLQNADEFLGITNPIINKFIFDSDFVFDQTKLHAMNRLSGKVFNPVGIIASLTSDEDEAISQALRQSLSDIVGGGAYSTTDGKTFDSVFDNDFQKEIFSAEGFKSATEGDNNILNAFVEGALSSIGQSVGLSIPTKSILAQVVAYDNNLESSIDSEKHTWFEGEDTQEGRGLSDLELNPIGIQSINYLFERDLAIKDPIKYFELRRKIRGGELAQNILTPKPDDIFKAEKDNVLSSNKVVDQIRNFIDDRIFDSVNQPTDFYKRSTSEYKPDEMNERDLTERLISHYFQGFIKNDDLNINDASGAFLKREFERISNDFLVKGQVYDVETDRLEKLDRYNAREDATDTEKLHSISKMDGFVDEENPDTGYKSYNIAVKLSDSLKRSIRNKTFSEYRRILDDNNIDYDDEVLMADIQPSPENIGDGLGTTHFMSFEDIRTNKVCYLRPSFDNLNEDIQINNSDIMYLGRTEALPNYENTTRTITFPFTLYSQTPNEFVMMYKKISFLKSLAYPIASESDDFRNVQNPLLKFTLGDVFKRVGGYLNTLNFTYSNQDITWETERGFMAPKIIECSLSFTVLHDTMPFVTRNNVFNYEEGETDQFIQHNIDYSQFNS